MEVKVPLQARIGRKGLSLMYGKRGGYILPPFHPYFLVSKDGADIPYPRRKMTNFSDGKEVDVFTIPIELGTSVWDQTDPYIREGFGVEANKPIEQLFIDEPEFLRSYPNGNTDCLCIDIEVYTDGSGIFPSAERCPIISIACKYEDQPPVVFMKYGGEPPDKNILLGFLSHLRSLDPDIICTYNGIFFDLPYIYRRAQICEIDLSQYSRRKLPWEFNGRLSIPGQLHYDLYAADVAKAQDIMGIKNRKLKTVAKWYDIPVIELDRKELSNTSKIIGTKTLREYNTSDVEISMSLYRMYIMNHVMMSEFLGTSLDSCIDTYPSFPPKIVLGRALKGLGYVFLDSNESRYPEIIHGKYEGGFVEIMKPGLSKRIWKIDAAGFYPSTMAAFNISPETTKIERIEPYGGEWKHRVVDGKLWLRVPDAKLERDIVISIDQSRDGVLSKLLAEMKLTRMSLKKKIKEGAPSERLASKARSDALKVLMNAVYGSAALPETVYSDLSVAISTIAICRLIFTRLIDRFRESIVEADSVVGTTPIWVRTIDRTENLLPIEEVFRRYAQDIVEDGGIRRSTPSHPIETITRSGWSPITQLYSHHTDKDVYCVSTPTAQVGVTKDHSLFLSDRSPVKPEDLKIGESILEKSSLGTDLESTITPSYASFLAFFLMKGKIEQDEIRLEASLPKNITDEISRSHTTVKWAGSPGDIRLSKCRVLQQRVENICFLNGEKKVPRAVLLGDEEIKKSFLSTIRHLSAKKNTIHCPTELYRAGITHLLLSLQIPYTLGDNLSVSIKRKPREDKVLSVTLLEKKEREVFDLTTGDGTFVIEPGHIVAHNTDGIYVDRPLPLADVQTAINEIIAGIIENPRGGIDVERSVYGPGFFHKAKNYVVLDADTGEPEFHGVAFKGSSHPGVYDELMTMVARMVLQDSGVEEIWSKVQPMLELESDELSDFIMRTTIRHEVYENESAVQPRLAEQARAMGIDIMPGTQVEYVVTKAGYKIASSCTIEDVDRNYYRKEMYKVLALFGLGDIHQTSLGL